jgi:hypothetical protein
MKRELILRLVAVLLVIAGMVLLNDVFAQAQGAARGTWTAKWQSSEQTLNLQMSLEEKESNFGQTYRVADLKGLSPASITGAKGPAQFQLVRDAGTIAFDGAFDRGLGAGTFTFTPDANYQARMRNLGYSCIGSKQFEMAALDVSLAYATEFKDLGFGAECKDLVEGRIFNVNRQQVEELRALGYTNVPFKKLVELRIFKVDGAYIRSLRAQGMDLSLAKLVESRIFEIKPEDRKAYADLGYTHLTQDELTAFKIHGVTPAYIRDMRDLGFKDLSPQKLQEFRIFGVGRAQIEDLKSVGYSDLTAQDLVNFKIHGVNSEFIKKVQKYGYQHPSADKLVQMKIMGIRAREDEDDDTL